MAQIYTSRQFLIEEYQHEQDRELISQLVNSSQAEAVMDFMRKNQIDGVYQYVYQSSYPRLTSASAPLIMDLWQKACGAFGLDKPPPIYVTRQYEKTVHICGVAQPFLLISSRYLERLEQSGEKMLFGILAAQAAGIRAGHHRGLVLAWALDTGAQWLPAPLTLGIEALVNNWKRCRLFTCDRAFLLATEDYPLALRSLFVHLLPGSLLDNFAFGTSNDAYLPQVSRFQGRSDVDLVLQAANSVTSDASWLPGRYEELAAFHKQMRG